jgi:uncharacterized membrane protein
MEAVLSTPHVSVATPVSRATYRINSIDLLRGIVMVIMALDHVRGFFHIGAFTADPLDLQTTSPALFFTRWITHFCAPIFVFLSGASAFFQSSRKTTKELSGFLIKRGLWLILVELAIITFAISFDISYSIFFLQVIWAIGISMVLLGLAVWLPFNAILGMGLLIVLGHNIVNKITLPQGMFWDFLFRQGFHPMGGGRTLGILYPFLPWTGLMFLGYGFGKLFTTTPPEKRRSRLLALSAAIILFFIALRATNLYGDPSLWSLQKNGFYSMLSFINTTKYPPSLLYMCMTIGPGILFLALIGNRETSLGKVFTVFGKVPFFYYVLHFFLIHLVSAILFLTRGHSFSEGTTGIPNFPFRFIIPGEGLSLGMTYVVWIAIVVALYPLCKWFSDYKKTHKQWWLSYL